jgi:DNA replication protein DnaC
VLNGLKETEAIKRVRSARRKGVILDGPPGVGKSIASVWKLAKMLQFQEIGSPLYVSCISFPDLKSLYTAYKQYDSYLIDDLIASLSQPRLEIIIEIIYHAEVKEKPLFITSNGFLDLAKSSFPEAILSRLHSHCEYIKITQSRDLRIQ